MAKIFPFAFFEDKIVGFEDANLSIASSAVLYGLSVYTVFPAHMSEKGHAVFRLKDHFRRLQDSARIIGIDTFESEWDYEKFFQVVHEVILKNKPTEHVFARATIHVSELVPGPRTKGLQTSLSIFLYEAAPILPSTGARLKTSVWRRVPDYSIPSRAKVNGAYVNSVLAKQDALDSGFDDCVFLDNYGHVCELSAANIFLVRNGVLYTPDVTSDLLEGINRKSVIELAKHEGIEVVERPIDLTELYIADEVFAIGTSAYISSVSEIDGRKIGDGKEGPITAQIRKHHSDALMGNHKHSEKWLTHIG